MLEATDPFLPASPARFTKKNGVELFEEAFAVVESIV
jgi:hypothetical protein